MLTLQMGAISTAMCTTCSGGSLTTAKDAGAGNQLENSQHCRQRTEQERVQEI
jgi:hypothetical protein